MHKLAQPVKLCLLGPVLPPRAPAGRAATASSTRSAPRRSAPTRRSPTPRRSCCSPTCSPSSACPGSSCGSAASARSRRARAYLEELKAHLRANEGELSEDVRERIDINPLRAFDSDDEGTRGVMASAPTIVERLDGEDAEHFAEVRALLDGGRRRLRDRPDPGARPRLLHADDLLLRLRPARRPVGDRRRRPLRRPDRAARRPADAGGRLGGGDRADPAGAGRRAGGGRAATSFVAVADDGQRQRALVLADELRHAGLSTEIDLAGRSLKGQLKHADRIGARRVLILEADGRPAARHGERRAALHRPGRGVG